MDRSSGGNSNNENDNSSLLIGVLALQGAFEEHQHCLEAIGCKTIQVRNPNELEGIDGIVLPGGESTAMGLIGTTASSSSSSADQNNKNNMWESLKVFSKTKPTWGTCAGMILLAEKCVGTSPVIQNGQSLIGGLNILVCRNYFGSQISSFEMPTTPPPLFLKKEGGGKTNNTNNDDNNEETSSSLSKPFPGIFIRAPAILSIFEEENEESGGGGVEVLGRVVATPCRNAAVVLNELEKRLERGENVMLMEDVDALDRSSSSSSDNHHGGGGAPTKHVQVVKKSPKNNNDDDEQQQQQQQEKIELPGAADGSNAREVICVVRKGNLLCTAFHPELTSDLRWHEYFCHLVHEYKNKP